MSWWELYRRSKAHAFRSEDEARDANFGVLLIVAVVIVPIIMTIGMMLVLTT